MKRFTDTEIWKDQWYRTLSLKGKAFWGYVKDNCDNAGVWKIDWGLASFQIGETVDDTILKELNNGKKRVEALNDSKLLITEFISFQYKDLSKNYNLHKNVATLIEKHGIADKIDLPEAPAKPLKAPSKPLEVPDEAPEAPF